MPFTPFHFGPGALLKSIAPRQLSFTVFAFSQFLIDLEPALMWVVRGEPVHPYLHTYAGALPVALVAIWPGRQICEWALGVWNAQMSPAQARWLAFPARIGMREAALGAFLGAYSHVAIDSLMHEDMRPLAPFSQAGRLTGIVAIDTLHLLCVAAGIAGLLVLAALRRMRKV